jgi:hypothetical protein
MESLAPAQRLVAPGCAAPRDPAQAPAACGRQDSGVAYRDGSFAAPLRRRGLKARYHLRRQGDGRAVPPRAESLHA